MKDIDFDELDRAVGTVLQADASTAKDPEPALESPEPVSSSPAVSEPVAPATSLVSDSQPAAAAPASTTPTPTIKPATSPARKRGQFLDMVHPSADMRHKNTMPTTPRKTLTPLNPVVTPTPPEEKPVSDDKTAVTPVSPLAPVEATIADALPPVPVGLTDEATPQASEDTTSEMPAPAASWPDPIEFAAGNGGTNEEPSHEEAVPAIAAVSSTEGEEPSGQTPFVPGVEVEKRPLGNNQNNAALAVTPVAEAPTDIAGPELSQEINSIEANGITETEPAGAETVADAAPIPEPEKPVEPSQPAAAPKPVQPEPLVGAQSIPQQYKTAAQKPDDDADHPLFDAQEYHQPLIPAGKKKSGKGILLIVLLIVLALVGAGLGYLAFNMGL